MPTPAARHAADRRAAVARPAAAPAVTTVRARWRLARHAFARLLSTTPAALREWESGRPPAAHLQRRLRALERLRRALAEIVPAAAWSRWLRTRNPAFDGRTPLELLRRGEFRRLRQMVLAVRTGTIS